MQLRTVATLAAVGALIGGFGFSETTNPELENTPFDEMRWAQDGPVEIPDTAVGTQLAWLLALINGEATTIEALSEHFTDGFLADAPAAALLASLEALAETLAPFELNRFEGEPSEDRLVAVVVGSADLWFGLALAVDPEQANRISTLQLVPNPELSPAVSLPETWVDFEGALRELAQEVNFLAAEVIDGACQPVYAVNADLTLSIGSAFKLWILAELARQVNEGLHSWDETVALREDWKVIPTGDMYLLDAGTESTLRHYAEKMISISDNTATDHLMHVVGRESVETMLTLAGHANPDATLPFLFSQEFMTLKLQQPADDVLRYIESSIEERRSFLETELLESDFMVAMIGAGFWDERKRGEVGWFASANDLCNVMAYLQQQAPSPDAEPLSVLSLNRGAPTAFTSSVWTYVGFKGGSEPGVSNGTWLMERNDGRWFVITTSINNPVEPVSTDDQFLLLHAAVDLLATHDVTPSQTGEEEPPPLVDWSLNPAWDRVIGEDELDEHWTRMRNRCEEVASSQGYVMSDFSLMNIATTAGGHYFLYYIFNDQMTDDHFACRFENPDDEEPIVLGEG